ncbi:Pycsar system effector family protein [Gillisia hiemivivida]|uniref:ABC transporter ATP-binding protein n=1 Tax=Gillisia hiemivivida TaxID=291190 RepID=A0A5C6ZZD9_9FLAO|nr:Pycsar system effector family protein [Gillisia hiemivivida]TXD95834.1 ABC transporter ATP-binding protein [Gillisia hiemivivida]
MEESAPKQSTLQGIPEALTPKNKYTDDLIDHYWGSINYISTLIKASELKAGLILSFYGILLNFIFKSIGTVLSEVSNANFFYVLIGLWFLCTAISIYNCVRCFIPKIERDYDKNIFFFGDVITKFGSIKEFAKTFHQVSVDEDQLFEQLGEQIYIISKIAAWKFSNVKRAIWFLAFGLLIIFISTVYYFILSLL